MEREYKSGIADNIKLFVGYEVEKTPAYNMKTLFVTGVQGTDIIEYWFNEEKCSHIFFGANHSYDPVVADDWEAWEYMIEYFLKKNILCSLDIPLSAVEEFNEGGLNDYYNFIPQIRVPLPYLKLWNYNTMVKIDDKGFRATNPGVWCHSLHSLTNRDNFTNWDQYGLDKVLE
jgi:hypothetical protein